MVTSKISSVTQLRRLRPNGDEKGNKNEEGVSAAAGASDPAAIEERAGLADRVPPVYLDAWSRLNRQKPPRVSEADGGSPSTTADASSTPAEAKRRKSGWTPGELFDLGMVSSGGWPASTSSHRRRSCSVERRARDYTRQNVEAGWKRIENDRELAL